jgi:hypothetical protein
VATIVETDAALSLGRVHVRALGIAPDVNTALPLGRQSTRLLGTAGDVSAARPLGRLKVRLVGTAVEIDTALQIVNPVQYIFGTPTVGSFVQHSIRAPLVSRSPVGGRLELNDHTGGGLVRVSPDGGSMIRRNPKGSIERS